MHWTLLPSCSQMQWDQSLLWWQPGQSHSSLGRPAVHQLHRVLQYSLHQDSSQPVSSEQIITVYTEISNKISLTYPIYQCISSKYCDGPKSREKTWIWKPFATMQSISAITLVVFFSSLSRFICKCVVSLHIMKHHIVNLWSITIKKFGEDNEWKYESMKLLRKTKV